MADLKKHQLEFTHNEPDTKVSYDKKEFNTCTLHKFNAKTENELDIRTNCAKKIQGCFRHFLLGRQIRNSMKYNYNGIWKLKTFVVRCALDDSAFLYSGSYKNYVNNVYKSIEVWINQDSDDEEDYGLTNKQQAMFQEIKKLDRISFADIKKLLKCLTLEQIQFIQLP